MASAIASTAAWVAFLRRYMTTVDASMAPNPSASVNSRQPAGMLLRDSGAIARPEETAIWSPALVSLR